MKVRLPVIALLAFVGLAADVRGAIPKGGYGKPVDCRVDMLIDSTWGQTTTTGYSSSPRCYNYYITNQVDAASDYAGCLVVAVAQLMRKWQYGRLTNSVSAKCCVSNGKTTKTKTLKTIGGTYSWANMPAETVRTAPTAKQRKAIGKLMYDLAVASGSTFTPTGTFASASVVRARMKSHVFGFANTEDVYFNSHNCPYSVSLLGKLLIPGLDCGAPAILSIAQKGRSGVHAALVDGYGYDEDARLMLHANFGAWGNGDGWYYADEGFHVGDADCTVINECLFNLFPTKSGTAVSGRVLDASRRAVQGATVRVYSGTKCKASTLTGASGTYGFVLAAGSYVVKVSCGSRSAERALKVGATVSRQFIDNVKEGSYWSDEDHAPIVGNCTGNDLILPSTYSAKTATPTVTPGGGASTVVISSVTNVSLACATRGAVIRYTLDGSDPTTSSPVYEAPFVLGDEATLKAAAFARNREPSGTVRVRFVYENEESPAGNLRATPMMLTGTNLTRTVQKYVNYTRAGDDPIVDKTIYDYNPAAVTESHAAWFRWTAPGSGTAKIFGSVMGPSESDYYEGAVYPLYGICMAVYEESHVSTAAALARTESGIEGGYAVFVTNAEHCVTVEQGKSYLIQCECPYHLQSDYIDQFYFGGPYRWSSKTRYAPFDSSQAYLQLELKASLVTVPPALPQLTVPAMANATVVVKADGETVLSAPGTVSLEPRVDYTVTYTAREGYRFADDTTVWTTILRDDTGLDISVAEVDGYPTQGATARSAAGTYRVDLDGAGADRAAGQVVTAETFAERTVNGTNVVCRGWVGTGDVPATGVGTQVTFTVSQPSTLRWLYATNYWFDASASTGGSLEVVASDCAVVCDGCWVPAGTEVSMRAVPDVHWHFIGWDNGSSAALRTEAITATKTWRATFARDTCTVRFDANGGSGSMEAATLVYKTSMCLPSCGFVRTGCVFAGWALSPTAAVVYSDGDSALDLLTAEGDEVVLYAVWQATLTVKANDSNAGSVSGSGTYNVGAKVTLKASAKSGYVFAGWFTDKSCTKALNPSGYDNRRASIKYVIPAKATKVYAKFITKSADKKALKFSSSTQKLAKSAKSYLANAQITLNLGFSSSSLPTVTATGLPAGLSIDALTGVVSGTAAKPGAYTAKVTVKSAAGNSISQNVKINITAPSWSYGTFVGYGCVVVGSKTSVVSATFTATSVGKVSGKVVCAGKSYSFSSNYSSATDAQARFAISFKIGSKTYKSTVKIGQVTNGLTYTRAAVSCSSFELDLQKTVSLVSKGKALAGLIGRIEAFKKGATGAGLTKKGDKLSFKFADKNVLTCSGVVKGAKFTGLAAPIMARGRVAGDGFVTYTLLVPIVEPTTQYARLVLFEVSVGNDGELISVTATFEEITL